MSHGCLTRAALGLSRWLPPLGGGGAWSTGERTIAYAERDGSLGHRSRESAARHHLDAEAGDEGDGSGFLVRRRAPSRGPHRARHGRQLRPGALPMREPLRTDVVVKNAGRGETWGYGFRGGFAGGRPVDAPDAAVR